MDVYKILDNTCVLHTTAICRLSSFLHWQPWLLPAKSQCWSTTDLFLTNFLDLVLWKCSYGPWDHFMFSANTWFCLQHVTKQIPEWISHFSNWCTDAKFHHAQCGKRLLYFRERLLNFRDRLLYFWERRLFFRGAPDSANNADKVAR